MKRFYFLASLLIELIVAITACGSPAPAEVVAAHVKALNAGDITALAALYTDDVVFSFGPVPPEGTFHTITGKAEVLADDLKSIAKNTQLTLVTVPSMPNSRWNAHMYLKVPGVLKVIMKLEPPVRDRRPSRAG